MSGDAGGDGGVGGVDGVGECCLVVVGVVGDHLRELEGSETGNCGWGANEAAVNRGLAKLRKEEGKKKEKYTWCV